MIIVTYNQERNSLSVKGHAQAGEFGKDLICAAASILTHTLAENLRELESAGYLTEMTAEVRDGEAKFFAKPCNGYQAITELSFHNIMMGYQILAQKNPENISVVRV